MYLHFLILRATINLNPSGFQNGIKMAIGIEFVEMSYRKNSKNKKSKFGCGKSPLYEINFWLQTYMKWVLYLEHL